MGGVNKVKYMKCKFSMMYRNDEIGLIFKWLFIIIVV